MAPPKRLPRRTPSDDAKPNARERRERARQNDIFPDDR